MTLPVTEQKKPSRAKVAFLALLTVLMLWQLSIAASLVLNVEGQRLAGTAPDGSFEDVGVFYAAGKMVLRGDGARIYDMDSIAAVEQESWGPEHRSERLGFFNPPFVALFFAPLALLSLTTFSLVWMLAIFGMMLLGVYMIDRLLGLPQLWQRGLLYLAFFASPAASWLLAQEQLTMFVFFAWLGFYWFARQDKDEKAGAMLVLALVKPQLVVPLLAVLVWQRRWRALVGFAAPAAVLFLVSIAVSGPGVLTEYPRLLMRDATEAGAAYRIMFSWVGLTARMIGEPPPALAVLLLNLSTLAAMAFVSRRRWGEHPEALPLSLAALLCGALLISPHLYRPELMLVSLVVLFGAQAAKQVRGTAAPWPAIGLWLWLAFILDIETGMFMASTAIIGMGMVVGYTAVESARRREPHESRLPSPVPSLEAA